MIGCIGLHQQNQGKHWIDLCYVQYNKDSVSFGVVTIYIYNLTNLFTDGIHSSEYSLRQIKADMEKDQIFPRTCFVNNQNFHINISLNFSQ